MRLTESILSNLKEATGVGCLKTSIEGILEKYNCNKSVNVIASDSYSDEEQKKVLRDVESAVSLLSKAGITMQSINNNYYITGEYKGLVIEVSDGNGYGNPDDGLSLHISYDDYNDKVAISKIIEIANKLFSGVTEDDFNGGETFGDWAIGVDDYYHIWYNGDNRESALKQVIGIIDTL